MEAWAGLLQTAAPGARLLSARPLPGGSSAQMTALDVALPDGRLQTWVARRGPALAREAQLLPLAAQWGLPVPRVLAHVPHGDSGTLLLDYIPGQIAFAPPDEVAAAQQMAAALARIHSVAAGPELDYLPARPGDCRAAARPPLAGALPTAALHTALRAAGPPRPNPAALLHGDFWPGNVLWQDGRLAAVLDWEDAGRGDPLRDLAIARLDLATIWGATATAAFTESYRALQALDFTALPYWDLCAALRLARLVGSDLDSWAAFFAPFGRADITAQTVRAAYTAFTAAALKALAR